MRTVRVYYVSTELSLTLRIQNWEEPLLYSPLWLMTHSSVLLYHQMCTSRKPLHTLPCSSYVHVLISSLWVPWDQHMYFHHLYVSSSWLRVWHIVLVVFYLLLQKTKLVVSWFETLFLSHRSNKSFKQQCGEKTKAFHCIQINVDIEK